MFLTKKRYWPPTGGDAEIMSVPHGLGGGDAFAVELRSVTRHYGQGAGEVRALDGISLTLPPRLFTVVSGPSGSGKSTLLNLLGCLDTPSSGSVVIAGQDTGALSERALTSFRARHVGFVFQDFNLLPVLTAFENIEFPLRLTEPSRARRREMVMAVLDAVGLGDKARRRPSELSGGQQQRVAVARALVKQPALVLADEPTANLDEASSQQLIALMRTLQRQSGTTFVFSSHDPTLIAAADRHVHIRNGRLDPIHADAAIPETTS